MQQYLDLLQDVMHNGEQKPDRTGTGTLSVFGRQVRYDLSDGFPAVSTKNLFFKGVVEELLWFLRGETNIKSLQDKGVKIWDAWADAHGDLGPVYGKQWRSWFGHHNSIDQISNVINSIKNDPHSRRHLVSAWNVADLEDMALVPCHLLFQFYVSNGKLSCQLYQRSADLFLGVPFNIASYALLTCMIAQVTGYEPGEFVHTIGDAHIYQNHTDQVEEQLTREPKRTPTLYLDPDIKNIDDFRTEHIALLDYNPHPSIKAPVAV